jgi:hypothetical protein
VIPKTYDAHRADQVAERLDALKSGRNIAQPVSTSSIPVYTDSVTQKRRCKFFPGVALPVLTRPLAASPSITPTNDEFGRVLQPVSGNVPKRQRLSSPRPLSDNEEDSTTPANVTADQSPVSPDVSVVKEPYTDSKGLVRVGAQPVKVIQPMSFTASHEAVTGWMKRVLRESVARTESEFEWATPDSIKAIQDSISVDLRHSLSEHTNNRLIRPCDYSGAYISWSTGPRAVSLEGIYPYVSWHGNLAYHVPGNVCIATSILNWIRGTQPPILLPLFSVALRASEECDFVARKRQMSWAVNALTNCGILHRLNLGTANDRKRRLAQWAEWTHDERISALQAMRTGTLDDTAVTLFDLCNQNPGILFRVSEAKDSTTMQPDELKDWQRVYRTMVKIAAKYGLTASEFDFYCTIPVKQRRVFFPYHVLAVPQAQSINWDWPHLRRAATAMLKTMRQQCNKHAENAGLGDPLTPIQLLYWWATFLCDKVQSLKTKLPLASMEEIQFSIVDRWGLPILPWVGNPLKASLCRGPDHGIAMKFGLTNSNSKSSKFDPVEHIDLSQCTVTIDAKQTNIAMKNYEASAWDSIRDIAKLVPLHHPFWRVDSNLGNTVWIGNQGQLVQPQAPVPAFDMHLIPLDAWMTTNVLPHIFDCAECPCTFSNPGLLVRHCQIQHGGAFSAPDCFEEDLDAAHWEYRCDFPGCNRQFESAFNLDSHRASHEAPTHKCTWPGCDKAFAFKKNLDAHLRTHKGETPYACDYAGCTKSFASPTLLSTHKKTHTKFKCTWAGCNKEYTRKEGLEDHVMAKHRGVRFKCPHTGCTKDFNSRGEVAKHAKKCDKGR